MTCEDVNKTILVLGYSPLEFMYEMSYSMSDDYVQVEEINEILDILNGKRFGTVIRIILVGRKNTDLQHGDDNVNDCVVVRCNEDFDAAYYFEDPNIPYLIYLNKCFDNTIVKFETNVDIDWTDPAVYVTEFNRNPQDLFIQKARGFSDGQIIDIGDRFHVSRKTSDFNEVVTENINKFSYEDAMFLLTQRAKSLDSENKELKIENEELASKIKLLENSVKIQEEKISQMKAAIDHIKLLSP